MRVVRTLLGAEAMDQVERTDRAGFDAILGVLSRIHRAGLGDLVVLRYTTPLQDLMPGEEEVQVPVPDTPYVLVLGLTGEVAALLWIRGVAWSA